MKSKEITHNSSKQVKLRQDINAPTVTVYLTHVSSTHTHTFLIIISKFFLFDFLSLISVWTFPSSCYPSSFFPSFFPALFHHGLVCFLQDISYHCSSVCSTVPLCFLPRLSLCLHTFVLRPPGSTDCLSALPRLMLLHGPWPSHSLSPMPREPAWLIKRKQTLRFPFALCKTPLIKE